MTRIPLSHFRPRELPSHLLEVDVAGDFISRDQKIHAVAPARWPGGLRLGPRWAALGRRLLLKVALATSPAAAAAAPRSTTPATGGAATRTATADTKDSAQATFIGFRRLGAARTLVYVELDRPVTIRPSGSGRTVEFILSKARVPLRNNRRPLLARHFDSPVQRAQLVPAGKDVKLVIQLREDATVSTRLVETRLGATFEVELARPSAAEGRSPASEPTAH